jgi:CHAT domain-containing protein/tetratricopeptide (TPR) repeat protein
MECEETASQQMNGFQEEHGNHSCMLKMLTWAGVVLFIVTSVVGARSVQTIDSEAQLASILCRNPKEDAANELLNKNAQLVNVTLWNTLLSCALSAEHQQSPAKSLEIYKLTLSVADRLNKPDLLATSYYYLGRTYWGMNDFERSIQAYETSRKSFEQAGIQSNLIHVLADLGALYLTVEDYEKAGSYSERSLAIAEQIKVSAANESLPPIEYGRARALQTLGQIDLRRGNHEDSLNKLREALALFERVASINSSYKLQVVDALISLAKFYGKISKYSDAFSYLTRANQVLKPLRDQNTSANIMTAQASLFLEQEDYAEAEGLFDASLATYRTLGNAREEARVLLNLAVIEQRQGHYDEALGLFQRSMEGGKSTKLADLEIAAGQGLAAVLTEKHDFPNALQIINHNLDIARQVNDKTREVELLGQAAQTYSAMQNNGESASIAEQALMLARSLRLPKLIYLATAALGEAYAGDGKVELAITTLNDAVNQVEELRDYATGQPESRYLFFEKKLGPYHTLIKLLTEQGKNFEALLYAERAKGRLLLEAVRRNTADLQHVLTPAEEVEIERLHDNVLVAYQRIQSESGHDPTRELNNQLDAARHAFASFEKTMVAAHPEVLLRTGPAQPLTYANLNHLVRADDLVYLEYVVTGDNIGVFILRRNGVTPGHELKYEKLPVSADELRRKVNEFHSALAERQPGYDSLGRELYRSLIEPVASELQNTSTLCIIPDEFLWTLPFQALTTSRGNYFVQEYSLFYAPSLSVLNEMALRRRQRSSKESLIAFGNPVIEKGEELKQDLHPILETEAEVAAVARAIRTRMTRVLVGRRADEKTFKALAPQYATIHLATHGVLDNRDPLNSYLLLTKTAGDWENDGVLQAREIIEMHLDADLAVLSACETGNGRISPGEGVIGMSWAFSVAGARSVVVSQWRVNSASTAKLMKIFYQALARHKDLNGLDKAQAFREASLRLLKDRRYRHPFYWAAFVLVSSN